MTRFPQRTMIVTTTTATLTLFAVCVALAANSTAAEPSPGEIIDAAIKTAGGAEAIGKQKAMTWSESGTYYGAGTGLPYKAKYANELPNRFRMEITDVFTIVFDGEKGWRKSMGNVVELDAEELAEQKENTYTGWVTTLLPLKEKAKEFTLAAAGEGKADGRATVGVKVSSKGHRDVTLSFDKETHLLAKVESTVKSPEQGGKEVKQEILLSDYVDVEKVKVAKKYVVSRDGEKFVEAEMSDIKIVDKHPEGTFGKPE
jgi:hypothetical protein